jgi:putative nucleotidyltransferase with HDIG domain
MKARAIRKPVRKNSKNKIKTIPARGSRRRQQRTTQPSRPVSQDARTGARKISRPRTAAGPVPKGAGKEKELRSQIHTLEAEVQRYRHRLTIVRQACLGLTLDMSLDRTLEGIAATVADFFSAEAVSCMLWDDAKQFMTIRAGHGFSLNYLRHQRVPAKVIQENSKLGRDYLVVQDLQRSPFGVPELVHQERLSSVLSVSMHIGEQTLGLLNIYSRNRIRNFTLSEIDNARLFAQQAAIAVMNVQLLSELKEEVQIANTLLQVAEDIGSLGSLDEVLNRIVSIITRALDFEVCSIFLWDKERGFYLPAKAVGIPAHRSPFFHTLILHHSDLEFTPGEQHQRTVISALATPRRFPVEKLSTVLGFKDLYFVPLVVKDHLLGAVVAGGYKGNKSFDTKDEIFFRGIAAQAAIAIDDANLFGELEQAFWDTIKSLTAAIEAKDHYTHDHSEAVIQYGSAMVKELNLPDHDMDLIRKACLLHDVGKIGIGDEILRKVAPLTPEERKIIEQHPIIGQEILSSVRSLSEVSHIIRHHHEHFDGNGYPDRLRGDQIPLLSRILQIADSFDAMTSDRPYRKALTRDQAVEELRKFSGRQFDPELVSVFLRVLDKLDVQEPDWSQSPFGPSQAQSN